MKKCCLIGLILVSIGNYAGGKESSDLGCELREHLQGTKWQWDGGGGEFIMFSKGASTCGEWSLAKDGLIVSWDAIDTRTVLLSLVRGRTNDLLAVLVFNGDMTSYTGFAFKGGVRLKQNIRLQPERSGAPQPQHRTSVAKECRVNMLLLAAAREQAQLYYNLPFMDVPQDKVAKFSDYPMDSLVCPADGTYTWRTNSGHPVCSVHGEFTYDQ
jgi:hypothetical protein